MRCYSLITSKVKADEEIRLSDQQGLFKVPFGQQSANTPNAQNEEVHRASLASQNDHSQSGRRTGEFRG